MKMDDNELKSLLQEAMEYEADCIMAEVESNPNLENVVAPEEIHDKLFQQINEHKASVVNADDNLSQEQKELIRLGKIYKKKRGRRKYIILIAAVLCALGVGMVSFGDGKKVFSEMKRMLGDREQTVVNSGDEDSSFAKDIATEEEAYEEINEKLGFWAVRMVYLPEGMEFEEAFIEEEKQSACLYYVNKTGESISYYVVTDYRTSSIGVDIEDALVREYSREVEGTTILTQEYVVEENKTSRWSIRFNYKDAQYWVLLMGIEENEVLKIIENLYFS